MSVKAVYVPRFGSQPDSSQRHEPVPDQTEPRSERRRDRRGNKRCNVSGDKTRLVLKVKFNNQTLTKKVTNERESLRRLMVETAANKTKTTVSGGGETHSFGADSHSAGGDVFFFSQEPASKAKNEKEKTKLAVLRSISRMLEENQLIRQRVAALSQTNRGSTD